MLIYALVLAAQAPQAPQDTTRPVQVAPIVVTATRSPLDPMLSPLPAAGLDFTTLRRDVRPSLADVVSSVAGVRALATGAQIAKPVIRGLGGARVLTLEDGHRLEDYSWSDEDGPSVDPRIPRRIEIIRGPASLLYGSDAIGGVINTIPEEIPQAGAGERELRWNAELFGASNNPGGGAGLEGEWARGAWGARAHVVGHYAGNTETPLCELENTGFSALNGEAALGVHGGAGSATLRFSRFGGEFKLLEAGGLGAAIPAGCPGGPPKPANETETGPERKVDDSRLQLDGQTRWHGLGLEAKAQVQDHTTIEVSDDITPGQEVETIHLGLRTVSLDLLAHHRIGAAEGTFGVSGSTQQNTTSGLAPLVPGATTNGAAVFAIERIPMGRVSLMAGLRGDVRRISADSNATLALGAQTRNASAVTGDLGLVVQLAPGLALAGNVGRAFRAPNLFELFSNGPRLGEARYEIGDQALKPEVSLNVDASLRWQLPRVRGEIAAFRNRIDDFIFVTPTSQFRQTGTVAAPDSMRVYLYGQAQATLWGGEVSLAVDPTDHVSTSVRAEFVHGQNDAVGQPLPLMPPARVVLGGEWHTAPAASRRWYVGAEVEGVAKQTRLAAYDIPGAGVTTYDIPTAGYVLVGLTGGTSIHALGRVLALDLRVRNLADASYRDYLNRYKEFALDAGRAVELRVGTEF